MRGETIRTGRGEPKSREPERGGLGCNVGPKRASEGSGNGAESREHCGCVLFVEVVESQKRKEMGEMDVGKGTVIGRIIGKAIGKRAPNFQQSRYRWRRHPVIFLSTVLPELHLSMAIICGMYASQIITGNDFIYV